MTTPRLLSSALAALGLAATLASVPAVATTVVPMSEQQLVASSSAVVRGTVVSVSVIERDVMPGVFTDIVVRVDEALEGAPTPGDELVLRVPGGQSDARTVVVPGMPTFQVGESLVLFLEPLPAAWSGEGPFFLPMGLEQGVWRRDESGAWFATAPAHGDLPDPDGSPLGGHTLDELRRMIDQVRP